MQEVLQTIERSLQDFDAVCMATALHAIASLRGPQTQYEGLKQRSEIQSLLAAISKVSLICLHCLKGVNSR